MNVNNFNEFLETLKEAKRRRQVCMLTEALMYLLRITQGHGMAALLGFPHACNNLEAVACWVAELSISMQKFPVVSVQKFPVDQSIFACF